MERATERHAQASSLSELLRDHHLEIETRWLRRVGQELGRHGLPETELRNSIPDYIVGLADALARAATEEDTSEMTEQGLQTWATTARHHALTRIQLGFDIDEVLREFMILRKVILEVVGEEGSLTLAQAERINSLIGGALRACVKSYVDSRDFEARKTQAKHIGFITHELRNPLAVAMAASGQVRKRAPELTRYSELIDRNLRRMSELIDQTLDLERHAIDAVESHPTELKLGEILDPAIKGVEASTPEGRVVFEVSYDPEILIHVDLRLAVSALENVIGNAAKFTDHGKVVVKVDENPEEVVVHVFDECNGLSAEELRTIFEPFKRGHTHKPGFGLGLAIARQAVEAHGKTIHAESTGNHGCHFWFALPKAGH